MAVREELKDYRKKLKDFQSTFRKEIGDISTQQDKDLGVATDILAQRIKSETGTDPLGRKSVLPQQERREPREIRRDLLSREGAVKQAREELDPQYEAILGQLRESIAATRQATPQQLAARGQALGGMRSATEAGLTREEAYQTAGLQAQRAADIQSRAGQILTAQQEAQAAEQARQDALQQQQFQNQLSLRSAELQEQGFTADEAYRQAQLELQRTTSAQDEAYRQAQLAEQQRQFGLEFGLQQQEAAQTAAYNQARIAALQAERPDLSPYVSAAQGLQGQSRIDYINNLQTRGVITADDANQMKALTGVTPAVTTTEQVAAPFTGVETPLPRITDLARTTAPTVTQTVTTPEQVITTPTVQEAEFTTQQADEFLAGSDIQLLDEEGFATGQYDTVKVESILDSMFLNGQIDQAAYLTLYAKYIGQ